MQRSAFTLVEMLVAVAIILALSALIVAFTPSFLNSQKTSRGADLLQRWLMVAKQRARRDGFPRGVRLVADSNAPTLVRSLQYIEQPDYYTKGSVTGTGTAATVTADVSEGFLVPPQPALWSVQSGDFLDVSAQLMDTPPHQYKIAVVGTPAAGITPLTLANPLSGPVTSLPTLIIRAPRPTQGEAVLDLPQGVVVDLGTLKSVPLDLASNPDIVFLPGGGKNSGSGQSQSATSVGVRRAGLISDKIILWVRDSTADATNPGEQILITIYTRTGFIATHPVDTTTGGDPYSFTKDGRTSGS
jgi:prepilin-type N-terminal cleavage/methylation domain-containing protein